MNTHLIIAVHGVGEQNPGDTVDEVVGAATTQFEENKHLFRPVIVERDMVELVEERFAPEPRNAKLFPVHLRRIRHANQEPSEEDERAVVVEVFWADKSPAPKGAFWTMFDLLKVVLGLGYLAMENAESNRGNLSVGLVHAFTWVFYGFVAPMNAMLLIGSLLLLLDVTPLWDGSEPTFLPWIIFAHGMISLLIGVYVRFGVSKTYLVHIFGIGLLSIGAVLLAVLVTAFISPNLSFFWCNLPGEDEILTRQIILLTQDINCYTSFNLRMLGLSWVLNVSLAIAIGCVGLIGSLTGQSKSQFPLGYSGSSSPAKETLHLNDHVTGVRVIFPSICAAMVLFWMVITSSLWSLLVNVSSQISVRILNEASKDPTVSHEHTIEANSLLYKTLNGNIQDVLQTMSITTASFVIIILIAATLIGLRRYMREDLFLKDDWLSRMILNPVLQTLLLLSLLLVAIALISTQVISCDEKNTGFGKLFCWFTAQHTAASALLLAMGFLIYRLSHHISGGLGVLRDIVTYSVQERCAWKDTRKMRKANFTERNQINNRFKRTLHYSLEVFNPSRVTIISHSQGTVIATQMLQDKIVKKLLDQHGNPHITLVTMGSPVTHIYRRYFKEFFQVSLDKMPKRHVDGNEIKAEWFNIHRADDFVGMRIGENMYEDDPDLAQNFSVKAGGHTGYFTDYHVWKILWDEEKVRFRLFPSQFN